MPAPPPEPKGCGLRQRGCGLLAWALLGLAGQTGGCAYRIRPAQGAAAAAARGTPSGACLAVGVAWTMSELAQGDYENLLAFRTSLRRFLHWSETQARQAGITPAQHQLL